MDELLNRISSKELTEWIIYFEMLQEEEKKRSREMESKMKKPKRRA